MDIILKQKSNIIAAGTILLLVFLFISLSGTMTSGFHFVDDHEVLTIDRELQSNSLLSVAEAWIRTDIRGNARFRPVYIVHRIAETKVFGTNFKLWSLYNGLLFGLAILSFYLAVRNLKFSIWHSLVFIIAVFIGPQAAVLWRLGPGEGLAMTFLGLSFLFMSFSVGRPPGGMYNLLFIFFIVLASFTKESFLLAVPAVLFLKVSIEARNGQIGFFRAAMRNVSLVIPLIVMGAGLAYIFLFVGTGYASEGQGLGGMTRNVIHSILVLGKVFLYPLILTLALFIYKIIDKKGRNLKPAIEAFVFMILIVFPSILLYSSTGLEERYLLPSTIGLAYLLIIVLDGFKSESLLLSKSVIVVSFLVFIPHFISTVNSAEEFRNDGRETGILLKAIADNVTKEKPVLLIADPVESYELSVSLKTWLATTADMELQGYALVKEDESDDNKAYIEGWNSYFTGNLFDLNGPEPGLLIFLDKKISKRFVESSIINIEENFELDAETRNFALYSLK